MTGNIKKNDWWNIIYIHILEEDKNWTNSNDQINKENNKEQYKNVNSSEEDSEN